MVVSFSSSESNVQNNCEQRKAHLDVSGSNHRGHIAREY